MEPDRGNTQVDFIWQCADKKRIVQVKSSVEFTLRDVRKAAEELERVEADEYELILAGGGAS
jgi:chaperonin cofactor prefoldin